MPPTSLTSGFHKSARCYAQVLPVRLFKVDARACCCGELPAAGDGVTWQRFPPLRVESTSERMLSAPNGALALVSSMFQRNKF